MQIAPEVRELEELAGKANVKITRALAKAGVAHSTYFRWTHDGAEPLAKTVRKVRAAIEELSAKR